MRSLLVVSALFLFLAPAAASAQMTGLSSSARSALEAVPSEGTPPTGQHYYRSNEWRQDLLIPHLRGRGGALIGVGSDQNYTMAAMAGSELIVIVDFDPFIPRVHRIYGALLAEAETPDQLIAMFSDAQRRETEALLRRTFEGDSDADALVRHWSRRRAPWGAYLRRVKRLVRNGVAFSWLSDTDMFNHVRSLHQNGRVIARNGDVTAETTLRGVGEALTEAGIPARIVYFSNAEQFFPYTDSFQENMRALPTDDRSVVVRTIRHRNIQIADDGRWHFMVHEFPDFMDRMTSGHARRCFTFSLDLLSAGHPHLGRDGISIMTSDTPRAQR